MRVPLKNIAPTLTVELAGSEAWLERIYADFPVVDAAIAPPQLTGRLKLALDEAGTVRVHGKIAYAPYVPCSRCDRPIEFSLSLSLDARYLPEMLNPACDADSRREYNLSKADLDAYYIEEDVVDLEALINDSIHGEIPSRVMCTTEDGRGCKSCHADLDEESTHVYGPGQSEEPSSPFARLKDLKLPQ